MAYASRACARIPGAIAALLVLAACATARHEAPPVAPPGEHPPLRFIAYGDMRFTDPQQTDASAPAARAALVEQIATEGPRAVLLTGDVPWHGGSADDYAVFRRETASWRTHRLAVYPALGNHEFAQCAEAQCLENWWSAFPERRGTRWYELALGRRVRAIALDTDASLLPESPQRAWLEQTLAHLPPAIDFVVLFMHHPPVADVQTGAQASHNPRPNEVALAAFLKDAAARSHARFIVVAGHIHNYERREQDGIVYLVSGGGGAHPYEVVREKADQYEGPTFPNFHYLRFSLDGDRLVGEMIRLEDFAEEHPHTWQRRDLFEVRARR